MSSVCWHGINRKRVVAFILRRFDLTQNFYLETVNNISFGLKTDCDGSFKKFWVRVILSGTTEINDVISIEMSIDCTGREIEKRGNTKKWPDRLWYHCYNTLNSSEKTHTINKLWALSENNGPSSGIYLQECKCYIPALLFSSVILNFSNRLLVVFNSTGKIRSPTISYRHQLLQPSCCFIGRS